MLFLTYLAAFLDFWKKTNLFLKFFKILTSHENHSLLMTTNDNNKKCDEKYYNEYDKKYIHEYDDVYDDDEKYDWNGEKAIDGLKYLKLCKVGLRFGWNK